MDRIRIEGLVARGYHGVLPEEKRDGQDFVLDVDMELDLQAAGESDDLADTVSYAEVAEEVDALVRDGSLDLIEALAERVARHLLRRHQALQAVTVRVHKPSAPMPRSHGAVSVEIRRTREHVR